MMKRVSDFIFSFGLMIGGVALLFVSSVFFGKHSVPQSSPGPWPRLSVSVAGLHPLPATRNSLGGDTAVLPQSRPRPTIPLPVSTSTFSESLTAQAAIVVDDKTDTILFKKDSGVVRPLASITKLMSALVLSSLHLDWSTTTIVTNQDLDPSSHQLNEGEEFSLEDLWHVALIGSSNSAINTLVRASGLSPEAFVARMNAHAQELHLTSLRFAEPTGLNAGDEGDAADVVRLLHFALQVDRIHKTLQIGEFYAQPLNKDKARRVWTTDWLLNNWVPSHFAKESIVGKTGYIPESGYNFTVRIADDKGHAVRVAILGAADFEARFSEARDLAEWAFKHYAWPDEPNYVSLAE